MEGNKINDEVKATKFRIDTKNSLKDTIEYIDNRTEKIDDLLEKNSSETKSGKARERPESIIFCSDMFLFEN